VFLGGLTLTAIDRLVARYREVSRSSLTHTPIGHNLCLSPDLSAARDALRRGFASPMHVTQEGPDFLSRYCPVQACGRGKTVPVTVEPGKPQ
jgi:hypothetical protein